MDRRCPVPFVFTIHDLTRLRFPDFSYTDASFAESFGTEQLRLLESELADLLRWSLAEDDGSLFTR